MPVIRRKHGHTLSLARQKTRVMVRDGPDAAAVRRKYWSYDSDIHTFLTIWKYSLESALTT